MPDQQPLPPSETVAALRMLLFGRVAEMNHHLARSLAELTSRIDQEDHNGSLGILIYVDTRIQAMRNMLLVLREIFGG